MAMRLHFEPAETVVRRVDLPVNCWRAEAAAEQVRAVALVGINFEVRQVDWEFGSDRSLVACQEFEEIYRQTD